MAMITGERHLKAGTGWVVEMPDDAWHPLDDAARQTIVARCLQRAKEADCRSLSIFTIPDPVFPLYGHISKKRVWAGAVPTKPPRIAVECRYRVEINEPEWYQLTEQKRRMVIAEARDLANSFGDKVSGKYEMVVVTEDGYIFVEKGRV